MTKDELEKLTDEELIKLVQSYPVDSIPQEIDEEGVSRLYERWLKYEENEKELQRND